mmetsp:Transcript_21979/g.38933  ORF Transcript_21979/g.38933 Transcript_21979/m.38933 type:complete len:82 (+) Transcript_21979:2646-2891(+)
MLPPDSAKVRQKRAHPNETYAPPISDDTAITPALRNPRSTPSSAMARSATSVGVETGRMGGTSTRLLSGEVVMPSTRSLCS